MFTHHLAIREMRPHPIRLMQTHQPPDGVFVNLHRNWQITLRRRDRRDGIGALLTIPVTRSPWGTEIRLPCSGDER